MLAKEKVIFFCQAACSAALLLIILQEPFHLRPEFIYACFFLAGKRNQHILRAQAKRFSYTERCFGIWLRVQLIDFVSGDYDVISYVLSLHHHVVFPGSCEVYDQAVMMP